MVVRFACTLQFPKQSVCVPIRLLSLEFVVSELFVSSGEVCLLGAEEDDTWSQ